MILRLGGVLVACLLAGLVLFLITDSVWWLVGGLAVWTGVGLWHQRRRSGE